MVKRSQIVTYKFVSQGLSWDIFYKKNKKILKKWSKVVGIFFYIVYNMLTKGEAGNVFGELSSSARPKKQNANPGKI